MGGSFDGESLFREGTLYERCSVAIGILGKPVESNESEDRKAGRIRCGTVAIRAWAEN